MARAALWLLPLTAVSRAVTPGPTYLFGSDLVNPYGIEALAGVTWLTDTLPGLAAVGLTIAAAVSLVVPAFSEARSLAYLPLGLVGKRGSRSISSMG